MRKTKYSLLVGNGLNLIDNGGKSWSDLLNDVAGIAETKKEIKLRKEKPFTLWFEEISRNKNIKDLKEVISNFYHDDASNEYHRNLMRYGFKNILTTNYDYNLEYAECCGIKAWESDHTAPESRHSLFRRNLANDKFVWHIHGEVDYPHSLMLGHEQYMQYSHKILNFISTGVSTKVKERQGTPYFSKYIQGKTQQNNRYVQSWVDVFLETEVHIVGFSLDYSENHLWDLINRNILFRKNKNARTGDVYFHRCTEKKLDIHEEAKLSLLKALGVKVEDHEDGSYKQSYDNFFKFLDKHCA